LAIAKIAAKDSRDAEAGAIPARYVEGAPRHPARQPARFQSLGGEVKRSTPLGEVYLSTPLGGPGPNSAAFRAMDSASLSLP
jgi:hypothetical protein